MKRWLIACMLLCSFGPLCAQRADSTYCWFDSDFQAGAEYFPFPGRAVAFSKADAASIPLYRFSSWDAPVRILRNTRQPVRANHIDNYWYEVSFMIGPKKYRGFMAGQSLSLVRIAYKDGHFLFQVSLPRDQAGQFLGHLKLVKGDSVMRELVFDPGTLGRYDDSSYFNYCIGGRITGNRGLKNVDAILELAFGYQACGYKNGRYHVFITPSELKEGLSEYGMVDGDWYGYRVDLTFPQDSGGVCDAVLSKSDLFSMEEGDSILTEETWREFEWNGSRLKQTKERIARQKTRRPPRQER